MSRTALLLVAALVLALAWAAPWRGGLPAVVQGTVVRAVDGDTLIVDVAGHGRERVRVIGVDTPEDVAPGRPVQCWSLRAAAFTARVTTGRRVTLVLGRQRRDPYGRLLAYVTVRGMRDDLESALLRARRCAHARDPAEHGARRPLRQAASRGGCARCGALGCLLTRTPAGGRPATEGPPAPGWVWQRGAANRGTGGQPPRSARYARLTRVACWPRLYHSPEGARGDRSAAGEAGSARPRRGLARARPGRLAGRRARTATRRTAGATSTSRRCRERMRAARGHCSPAGRPRAREARPRRARGRRRGRRLLGRRRVVRAAASGRRAAARGPAPGARRPARAAPLRRPCRVRARAREPRPLARLGRAGPARPGRDHRRPGRAACGRSPLRRAHAAAVGGGAARCLRRLRKPRLRAGQRSVRARASSATGSRASTCSTASCGSCACAAAPSR